MKTALLVLLLSSPVLAATGEDVQARMGTDAAAGKPLLAHVIVCLGARARTFLDVGSHLNYHSWP